MRRRVIPRPTASRGRSPAHHLEREVAMVKLRDVTAATIGLACRGAVPLVGVAILLGMCSRREPAPPADLLEPAPNGSLARDEWGTLCLTLAPPEGQTHARCVVLDEKGVELMSL